jgi:integrase
MPRQSRGPYLWLRPVRKRARDGSIERAVWIIRDGKHRQSTGCGDGDRGEAERRLAAHIASKHEAPRRERDLSAIPVADVLSLYLTEVAPGKARPKAIAARCKRLLVFFGGMKLDKVNGASCRAYEAWREGKGPDVKGGKKGTGGGARRDLQDLGAAIGHHADEGFHRGVVKVVLPPRGEARQRWLTRSEAARLLWVCWRTREKQDGKPTEKRPLRHLCRFLLLGIYTGSRPGAILNASWLPGPARSLIDVEHGVFHRRADGAVETTKRQPTVKLAPNLIAHLRRWKAADEKAGRAHVVMFDGAPIQSVKTALGRAVELAGLPGGVTAYTLRHTCASWLVKEGVSTRVIADFLGTSETMILAHYGHLAPDYQDEAVAAIGSKGWRGKK